MMGTGEGDDFLKVIYQCIKFACKFDVLFHVLWFDNILFHIQRSWDNKIGISCDKNNDNGPWRA